MALINSELPTFLDHARRMNPDGSITKVIESLTRKNTLMEDAVVIEGNLPTGHRFTSRNALPTLYWRRVNEGISPSKSRADQVDETTAQLSGRSVVDEDLAKLNGNAAAFRASEDMAFVQAFPNELESAVFYHSTAATPERVNGLTNRLSSTASGPGTSQIVKLDATAAGNDQTSIWLINWSPEGVALFFPKGSQAGLRSQDMGLQYHRDASGKEFLAYKTDWKWDVGVMVKDYRHIVRICNIDTTNLTGAQDTLINAMIDATYAVPAGMQGRPVFYMNRRMAAILHKQSLARANNTITLDNVGGQPINRFLGIPIHVTDALLNTESVVA